MFERISLKMVELLSGLRREEGQGATEYAMVIGFLIIGLGVGLTVLGDGIIAFLGDVADSLPAVP
jgi:Flp pilus assembly pilin Flp